MIVPKPHFISIICNKITDIVLTMLNGKAGGMWHTEWFMQITGSHGSVVEDRGLLECDCITFPPDILKDHCAYVLRCKQSKNQSSPLGLPTLNPFHMCWGSTVIIIKPVSSSCDAVPPLYIWLHWFLKWNAYYSSYAATLCSEGLPTCTGEQCWLSFIRNIFGDFYKRAINL